jgi:hypothetical protein
MISSRKVSEILRMLEKAVIGKSHELVQFQI